MLSIEKCKEILNQPNLTDEQIEEIRSTFYDSANLIWDVYNEEKGFQKSL